MYYEGSQGGDARECGGVLCLGFREWEIVMGGLVNGWVCVCWSKF